jgi:hypothetical protein
LVGFCVSFFFITGRLSDQSFYKFVFCMRFIYALMFDDNFFLRRLSA